MKSPAVIISAIIILLLGAISFSQWQKNGELTREIARLTKEAADQAASATELAVKLQQQVDDRKQAIVQMEEQRKTAAITESAAPEGVEDDATKAKPETKDFVGMMKKMFTDPAMKKMMRSTQMIQLKMLYGDLGKKLGLSADQANQVMELLADRQMAMAGKSMKMFGGKEADAATTGEAGTEEHEAQLESLLGKDGMEKLTEYEKTMGERMQIQQYKQAFAANGLPLDDKESDGLFGIMQEERLKQPASPLSPGAKDIGAAMEAMQSDETFNRLMADQEAMDQRVLSRARNILSPDKMVQFEGVQKQQRDVMTMGAKMGREFLKQK